MTIINRFGLLLLLCFLLVALSLDHVPGWGYFAAAFYFVGSVALLWPNKDEAEKWPFK